MAKRGRPNIRLKDGKWLCRTCKTYKDLTEFSIIGATPKHPQYPNSHCKECMRVRDTLKRYGLELPKCPTCGQTTV